MSRNTLRGLGKSGGHKGTRDDASPSSGAASHASETSHPILQAKAIQELTPEELKERIKEELRKIRELDAPDPTAALDRGAAVPTAVRSKEPSLSATIMGMPLPPSLSSKTILVTGTSEVRTGRAAGPGVTDAHEQTPNALPDERTNREHVEAVPVEEVLPRRAGPPTTQAAAPTPGESWSPSGRELAVRAKGAVPQRLEWEATDVNPVGAPSPWAVPGEHDGEHHLPWYDQAPPHEEIYEEPKGQVALNARRAIGVLLGVTLALGTFYVIRSNGGARSRPRATDVNALEAPPPVPPRSPADSQAGRAALPHLPAPGQSADLPLPSAGSSEPAAPLPRTTAATIPGRMVGTTADVTRLRGSHDAARALDGAADRTVRGARAGPATRTVGPGFTRDLGADGVVSRGDLRPRRAGSDSGRPDPRRSGTSPNGSTSPSPPFTTTGTSTSGASRPSGQPLRGFPGQGSAASTGAAGPGNGLGFGQPSASDPTAAGRPSASPARARPTYDPDSTLPLNVD